MGRTRGILSVVAVAWLKMEALAGAAAPPTIIDSFKEYVERVAGLCEVHYVTTEDGYVNTMFRIPRSGPPVIVQHGVLDSSWDMVLGGGNTSTVAFAVASWGYDVWLPNARGNTFSRGHVSLSPDSDAYWNTTIGDLAIFDTPANVEYVRKTTGAKQVSYVGHSQGGASMFLGLSEWTWTGKATARRTQQEKARAYLQSSIRVFVGLSPVSYIQHTRSLLLKAVSYLHIGDIAYNRFDKKVFLPSRFISSFLEQQMCFWVTKFSPVKVCEIGVELICGVGKFDDKNLITAASGKFPAGTPVRNLQHFEQFIDSGNVGDFNFGPAINSELYGQAYAPNATLSSIDVPMVLLLAGNDDFLAPPDRERLLRELRPKFVSSKVFADFSHATWFVGNSQAFGLFLPDLKYGLEHKVLPGSTAPGAAALVV